MPEPDFELLIAQAVESVLETMFFSMPMGPAEPEIGGNLLEASLAFHGRPSGTLHVCLSETCARILAAGFLGEDEERLTDAQPGEVLCELANMLCGALVSKLESEETFDLESPQLVQTARESHHTLNTPPAGCASFELDGGILTVTLYLQRTL